MLRKKFLPLILLAPILASSTFFISCASSHNPTPVDPTTTHTFTVGSVPDIELGTNYSMHVDHTGLKFTEWNKLKLTSSNEDVLIVVAGVSDIEEDKINFQLTPISVGDFRLHFTYTGSSSNVEIIDSSIKKDQPFHVYPAGDLPQDPRVDIERVITPNSMSREAIIYGNLDEYIDIKVTASNFSSKPTGDPFTTYTLGSGAPLIEEFNSWEGDSTQYIGNIHIKYKPDFGTSDNNLIQIPNYTCNINVKVGNIESTSPVTFETEQWNPDENEYSHLDGNSKDILDYMNTITFSIFSNPSGTSQGYIGTGWILGKWCEWKDNTWKFDDTTNYSYWMATNLHVRANIDEANKPAIQNAGNFLFWNANLEDNYGPTNPQPEFSYPGNYGNKTMLTSETNYFATKHSYGNAYLTMDFSILKLSLSNLIAQPLKNKLDKINEICNASSDPRKLAITPTTSQITSKQDLYTLGYPSIKPQGFRLSKKHTYSLTMPNYYPSVKVLSGSVYTDADGNNYYDTGQIIHTGSYEGMRGGSSGSLVLDADKKAVAINFAGPIDSPDYFTPNGYALYTSLVKDGTNGYDLINGTYSNQVGQGQGGFYEYLKQKTI